MFFKSVASAFRQAWRQIFRNRSMSLVTLLSIVLMLLILGVFFVLAVNVNMVTESAKAQFDIIQVYLEDDATQGQATLAAKTLQEMSEVESVTYITKEQAMEEFKVKWGDNAYLLDGLTKNPLPNSLRVTLMDLSGGEAVAAKAKTFAGVEEVKYTREVVQNVLTVSENVKTGAYILIAFLIIVSVIFVSNTIKLTVLAREEEINIMKYVGATNWYIRLPFLFEGIFIGGIAALIADLIIDLLYKRIALAIGTKAILILSTNLVPVDFLSRNLFTIFLALGVSIGATGSIVSMRRFLDNKERNKLRRPRSHSNRNTEERPKRKGKHSESVAAILLAGILSASLVLGTVAPTYADSLSDAKSELADVQKQITSLQKEISNNKSKASSLNSQLATLDKSIRQAETVLEQLDQDIEDTKEKVEEAQENLIAKEAEVSVQDENMGKRIRTMYMNGDIGVLEILLTSTGITDFMTNLDMAQRISESDEDLLASLRDQYENLRVYREELIDLQTSLETKQTAQEARQKEMEDSKVSVAALKASVEDNLKLLEAQEDALNAEANALTSEILKLQSDGDYIGGSMAWPCPASTRITSKFGYRIHPILKTNKLHTGIDIGCASGKDIVAANAGTVIKAGWNNSYGYMVMIDHGGGIVTLYAHSSKLLVKAGDIVSRGQTIALVGSTGMSTGAHLHFEVRLNGVYQDPLKAEYVGNYVK